MYSMLNKKSIQIDCDGDIINDQSIPKPGLIMSSHFLSSMIPQEKCIRDRSPRYLQNLEMGGYEEICDKVLTYQCFLGESQSDPQFEDPRIKDCSISIQHFAHCPALNSCETKSVTTDAISILEDSFITYIESSKAKSFLGKSNGIAYPKYPNY